MGHFLFLLEGEDGALLGLAVDGGGVLPDEFPVDVIDDLIFYFLIRLQFLLIVLDEGLLVIVEEALHQPVLFVLVVLHAAGGDDGGHLLSDGLFPLANPTFLGDYDLQVLEL